MMLVSGDMVRHKKRHWLVKGRVTEISKSGKRALVKFLEKDNPVLVYTDHVYFDVSSLIKLEEEEQT